MAYGEWILKRVSSKEFEASEFDSSPTKGPLIRNTYKGAVEIERQVISNINHQRPHGGLEPFDSKFNGHEPIRGVLPHLLSYHANPLKV